MLKNVSKRYNCFLLAMEQTEDARSLSTVIIHTVLLAHTTVFFTHRKFARLYRFLPKQETTHYHQFLRVVSGSSWYNDGNILFYFSCDRFWFLQLAIWHWFCCRVLGSDISLHSGTRIDESVLLRCKATLIPSVLQQKENDFVDYFHMDVCVCPDSY